LEENGIFLHDPAQPKENEMIDLTLLTVMKEGLAFYEKYGYRICEPPRTPLIQLLICIIYGTLESILYSKRQSVNRQQKYKHKLQELLTNLEYARYPIIKYLFI
jgi:hypothetical protein